MAVMKESDNSVCPSTLLSQVKNLHIVTHRLHTFIRVSTKTAERRLASPYFKGHSKANTVKVMQILKQ